MPWALTLQRPDETADKSGKDVYHGLRYRQVPKKKPGPHEILLRINAAALNHRDLFIRQGLYPGISFDHPLLADGHGTIMEHGADCKRADILRLNSNVLVFPARGWDANPTGPEDPSKYSIIGGTKMYDTGTAQDFMVIHEDDVEPAPPHLSPVEGAALSLVGLTGWRALATKCGQENCQPGRNILITGIGGGVALQVLRFAVAMKLNVFVTSSNADKLQKAKALGARDGVSYRDADWDKQLASKLPKERPFLDVVIDGAGGDIVARTTRLLKAGGIIACYGMTTGPKMLYSMPAVLKNIELKGCTMGSRREFRDMIAFVSKHEIRPVVSSVVQGLRNEQGIEDLFEAMKAGTQFGKLVIDFSGDDIGQSERSAKTDDRAKL